MADYNSKYSGEQVEALLDQVASGNAGGGGGGGITEETDPIFSASPAATITNEDKASWSGKQDAIDDLATIRDGASKGATAVQPSALGDYAKTSALDDKVDKVSGKQLSTEDFTTALKGKLEGLSNYDDTELSNALSTLRTDLDKLVSGDTTTAIKTFNEIIAFLDGIEDSRDLESIIASIEQQIAGKMDKVTLATVATSGSYEDLKNKPTIPAEQVNADWNATSGKAQILNKPTIPSAVTESTVSGWGFTKNTGTYSKPSGGIPKSDLSVDVQSALNAANAYQGTVTSVKINGTTKSPVSGVVDLGNVGTYNKPSTGIPKSDLNSDVQTSLGKADNSLQVEIFGDMELITLNGFAGRGAGLLYALPNEATGDEDDVLLSRNTVKTINGESILGEGNIEIGGGSSSGNGSYSEVSHGTSDTTLTISPNTFHIWDEVSSLAITLGAETSGVANEYLFQFTSGSTATTLSLPDDIKWSGGETPTIEVNKIYQISILKGLGSVLSWDNAKTLTSNLCTYDGNKTVTFQYPVASDVIVYIGSSMSMAIEAQISVGEITGTFSAFPDPGSVILAITPIRDDTYNYIF